MNKATRKLRIVQSADDVFLIQELIEDNRPNPTENATPSTLWPFAKKAEKRQPRYIWATWRDATLPKERPVFGESRHPYYTARTLEQARDYVKKGLTDTLKFPIYHEV